MTRRATAVRAKTHNVPESGKTTGTILAVRRYHVTTFGCQMNAHDSERIKGMLEELGLGESASQDGADVLVFNTCTIREKPDLKFAAHLAQAAALKQHDPDTVIAVGGCYAEAQRERLFELYPYVDIAFGPGSIPYLGEWIGAGGVGVGRASGASRPGCRSRCAATRSAPTASARRSAGASRAADRARFGLRSSASRAMESGRSRCSARTSTPTAGTWRPRSGRTLASCCGLVTRSTRSHGSASPARTRRISGDR